MNTQQYKIDELLWSLRICRRGYAQAVHDGNEAHKQEYREAIVELLNELQWLGIEA